MKDIKNFLKESIQVNEGTNKAEEITKDLSTWWDEHITPDGYDSYGQYVKDLKLFIKDQNDFIADDAYSYLVNKCKYNMKDVDDCWDNLMATMKQWAREALGQSRYR